MIFFQEKLVQEALAMQIPHPSMAMSMPGLGGMPIYSNQMMQPSSMRHSVSSDDEVQG